MSDYENFEEILRSMAEGFGDSFQRKLDDLDIDRFSSSLGVDADQAREWVDGAASGRRTQCDARAISVPSTVHREDPLRHAEPHTLDLPSNEQGAALAA